MSQSYINLIGFVAAFFTTIAFLPQAIKVFKTKKTKDISIWMFLIFTTGVFLWLIYGILTFDFPIIFANLVTFILSFFILVCLKKYK